MDRLMRRQGGKGLLGWECVSTEGAGEGGVDTFFGSGRILYTQHRYY